MIALSAACSRKVEPSRIKNEQSSLQARDWLSEAEKNLEADALRFGGSRPGAADGCGLLSAGCTAALSRGVVGGDPGYLLRDRDAGAARAGYRRSQVELRTAGAACDGDKQLSLHLFVL